MQTCKRIEKQQAGPALLAGKMSRRVPFRFCWPCLAILIALFSISAFSQNKFEKHRLAKVDISIAGVAGNSPLAEEYRLIVRDAVGTTYSTPRIRDAIQELYETKRIDTVTVAAALDAADNVE